MDIIPAILTNSPEEAKALLSLCEDKARRVQIDIIDAVFADNKTITPEVFSETDTTIFLDYHLMVDEPIHWIKRCARGTGDRIIGQIEMMTSQENFVQETQANGLDVGLAIDLNTPVTEIRESLLPELDVILVMSVKAGFGGQDFNEIAFEKIKILHELREKEGYSYNICDDGGITLAKVGEASKLGTDEVAIGKRIFEGDLEENIEKFKKASMR